MHTCETFRQKIYCVGGLDFYALVAAGKLDTLEMFDPLGTPTSTANTVLQMHVQRFLASVLKVTIFGTEHLLIGGAALK